MADLFTCTLCSFGDSTLLEKPKPIKKRNKHARSKNSVRVKAARRLAPRAWTTSASNDAEARLQRVIDKIDIFYAECDRLMKELPARCRGRRWWNTSTTTLPPFIVSLA